jgi:hypothetical protein
LDDCTGLGSEGVAVVVGTVVAVAVGSGVAVCVGINGIEVGFAGDAAQPTNARRQMIETKIKNLRMGFPF